MPPKRGAEIQATGDLADGGLLPQARIGEPNWVLAPYEMLNASFEEIEAAYPTWSGRLIHLDEKAIGLRIQLPARLGRGAWDIIRASEDIYVMLVDAEYLENEEIFVPGDRLFKIRILLSGGLSQPSGGIMLKGTGAYLEAYPGSVASEYFVSAESRARIVVLHCRPELLTRRFGLSVTEIPAPINVMFESESGEPRGRATPVGPDVLRAANDILNAPVHYPKRLLNAFMTAKAEEIVCSVMRQLSRTPQSVQLAGSVLAVRDVGRIYEARDILRDRYVRPPSVPALARLIGVNRTKLKSHFKAVFNITIADFIQQQRMERARELLCDSQLTVGEVAYAVGYEYPANFTHAFKRYFGELPKNIIRSGQPRGGGRT
jgi:AraC-like DNA-binding protein